MGTFLIIYPVLFYFIVSMFVMCVLEIFMSDSQAMYTIRQTIGAAVTIPFIRKLYRMDSMLRNKVPEGKSRADKCLQYVYAAFTVAFLGVTLNNLIGLTPLEKISTSYTEVTNSFYGSTLAIELVGLGIVIPFAEELLYRGVLYGRIKDWLDARHAIVISAVIFGIVHLNLVQFLYAFLMGLLLAWFTERYHSFIPAFFGHAAANILSILRQELGIFDFMEKSTLGFLIWTIVIAGVTGSLFGLQFKVKKLQAE